jgi:putative spermidine/putrescine transport system permease protein
MVDDGGGLPLTAADSHEDRTNLLYRQVPTSSPLGRPEEVSRSVMPKLDLVLSRPYLWLLLPAVLALTLFFLLPLLNMIRYSVYTHGVAGGMQADLTLENFHNFFAQHLYWRVLLRTLGNAPITTLLALVLGYPMAFAIAPGYPTLSRVLTIAVVSPLLVGIVIRTYGWTVLLSRQGLVSQLLRALGLIDSPLHLMGNNIGVIISLLHMFYPFMVIPLATALRKIERPLEEAAIVLGANPWQVFWRVFVPLSIPGMIAGSVLVFLLTASSFAGFVYFPPPGWSLRWYGAPLQVEGFIDAFLLSLRLAALVTVMAIVLGTAASLGLTRYRFAGRELLNTFLMSPLIFPSIITGIALLQFSSTPGINSAFFMLTVGHTVITLPLVVRNVTASLQSLRGNLEEAARVLGASAWQAFFRVTLPLIKPGLMAGGVFAFIISSDSYTISMWLKSAEATPLPSRIFCMVENVMNPSVAAVSSSMIVLSVVLIIVTEKVVGLKRAMSM